MKLLLYHDNPSMKEKLDDIFFSRHRIRFIAAISYKTDKMVAILTGFFYNINFSIILI